MDKEKQELGNILVRVQEVNRELKRLRDELSQVGEEMNTLGDRLKSYPRSIAFGKPEEFLPRTPPTRFIVKENLEKFLDSEFTKRKLDRLRELEGKLESLEEKRGELEPVLYGKQKKHA